MLGAVDPGITDHGECAGGEQAAQIADLGLSIVARGRDGFRPRSSWNVGFICKAPVCQFIVRHSEVMPDGWRYIQAVLAPKALRGIIALPNTKSSHLTARSDVLQLRKQGVRSI